MTTTGFIIELLVIGIGVCFVLLLTALGVSPTFSLDIDTNLAVLLGFPALCFAYVLGVVFDRLMNELFDFFKARLFHDQQAAQEARLFILFKSEKLSELYLYAASRERICRSWSVLAVLIAPLTLWNGGQLLGSDYRALVFLAAAFFLLLGISCGFAWYTLAKDSVFKTKEIASGIRSLSDSVR